MVFDRRCCCRCRCGCGCDCGCCYCYNTVVAVALLSFLVLQLLLWFACYVPFVYGLLFGVSGVVDGWCVVCVCVCVALLCCLRVVRCLCSLMV